jgi:acyl dehydratase
MVRRDVAPLYLEDLYAGQRFVTPALSVDAEQIKAFARAFDPQPFHLDEQAAQASIFGELVASGWHTAAMTMRLIVTGGPPLAGGAIGVGGEIQWPRPVRPGDILHLEGEVTEVTPSRSKSDRGTVTIRYETKTADGTVVQIFVAKVIVPRRPAATF